MATIKSANVTKFDAGGSGDNYIADGYIKTVEKVWIDTYAVAAAIPSTSNLLIGYLPPGKKLLDVIVQCPVLTGAGTDTTINCGSSTIGNSGTTGNLGFLLVDGIGTADSDISTVSTYRLGHTGMLATSSNVANLPIYIQFDPVTSITAGTIKTIIKYA